MDKLDIQVLSNAITTMETLERCCGELSNFNKCVLSFLRELRELRERREEGGRWKAMEPMDKIRLRDFDGRMYGFRGDCPACGMEGLVSTNAKYCPNCGQALDWNWEK